MINTVASPDSKGIYRFNLKIVVKSLPFGFDLGSYDHTDQFCKRRQIYSRYLRVTNV